MLPTTDFKIVNNKNSFNLIGKIKVKVVLIVAMLTVGLFFAQLVFANSLSTDGIRLARIEQEIKGLETENTNLKNQIAAESSLVKLAVKANQLGFRNPPKSTSQ